MYQEKNLGGERSGLISEEVDKAVRPIVELEREIAGYEKVIENMTGASAENVSPKELEELRLRLTELRRELAMRQDLAK